MYRCCCCNSLFDEPNFDRVNAEDYFGVSSMFDNYNETEIAICPECGAYEIETYWEDEEEDNEWQD